MKKIYFRKIAVEITRRCQLMCEHCCRGDAQDLDISNDIIDTFLEQTAGIGELMFTGGEPTLAPDKMNYFVDCMIDKGIPLGGISYITNGVALSEEVKVFLTKAYSYVTTSRENNEIFRNDCKIYFQPRIKIALSIDNFHVDNEKVKREYERVLPSDSCSVTYIGNVIPTKIGRGRKLQYGYSYKKRPTPQIGMEYEAHPLVCDDSPRSEAMLQYCDAFIPCSMVLTAVGRFFPEVALVGEYNVDDFCDDDLICQFKNGGFPSIFDSVVEYNKGRMPCYLATNIPVSYTIDDLISGLRYKKVHDIDTKHNTWAAGFDKIFQDDINIARAQLSISRSEHVGRYVDYLKHRIPHYSDIEEIRRDFPNCNAYFCEELQKMLEQNSLDEVIKWIIITKDEAFYSVDDAHFEYAKHCCNQYIMAQYKTTMEKIGKFTNIWATKTAANKTLLNTVRDKLAR